MKLSRLAVLMLFSAGPALAGARVNGHDYPDLQSALDAAQDGDTVTLAPGTTHEAGVVRQNRLILAGKGAHLNGVAAEGKAALVIKGNDVTVMGLECSGISVGGGNGACIRAEGTNLTLDGVYFHDSEEGLLSGGKSGRIEVRNSRFERLGAARSFSATAGLAFRDTDERGNATSPIYQRAAFGNLFENWDS